MKFKKTEKCETEAKNPYIVLTSNFQERVSRENTRKIIEIMREKIGCKGENEYGECAPNFIIFDPDFKKEFFAEKYFKEYANGDKWHKDEYKLTSVEKYEDEDRSLHISAPWLEEKVYVKLDDYGSKENLKENCGFEVSTRFTATIMLPEDY